MLAVIFRKKIPVSIIGGTGYSGEELIRILLRHPSVRITSVFAQNNAGKSIGEVFPGLDGIFENTVGAYDASRINESEIFFLALPSGEAMKFVPDLLKARKKVIDLSADYRLHDPTTYQKYYGHTHSSPDLIKTAIYSIPELHQKYLAGNLFVANPGCYPTSAVLPLAPLLKEGVLKGEGIVINSLSGVTGAGKKATLDMSFAEVDNSVKAYKLAEHQHTPEIEQALENFCGKRASVTFTPHLLPIKRGIYTTTVADLDQSISSSDVEKIYCSYYGQKPFVRLRGSRVPELKHVIHSNFIDIGWKIDAAKKKIILISTIDNLIKGAAGQAVQNMNLLCGLPEETALM